MVTFILFSPHSAIQATSNCPVCPEAEPCECTAPTYSTTNTTAVTTEHAHGEDTPLSPGASGEGQQSRTDSCTAIGGRLGALAVVLALTLVGVVLG